MSGVHIEFGAQSTREGATRPWWRVVTKPSLTKVYLTEDLDAIETSIENHKHAMDHLWTKIGKPWSERDKNEPHQPRIGHPSQYAWRMARAYKEEHGASIRLASEKHTESEFHKPDVLMADAKSIVDDQGFGYTLSWNHGIRNDTVPTSKSAADTLNEQRTQAKLLHHYFVGEYQKLTQASRESLFPRRAFSEASRAQIMSSLDVLLNKARMDMSTVLEAGPAPDVSVPGLSLAGWEGNTDSQAVALQAWTSQRSRGPQRTLGIWISAMTMTMTMNMYMTMMTMTMTTTTTQTS